MTFDKIIMFLCLENFFNVINLQKKNIQQITNNNIKIIT